MTRLVMLSLAYTLSFGASGAAQASKASLLVDLDRASKTGCISKDYLCGPDNIPVDGKNSSDGIDASIAQVIP